MLGSKSAKQDKGSAVNASGPQRWSLDCAVWQRLGVGVGTRIALIDVGVMAAHPELVGRIEECRSYVDNEHAWLDDDKSCHGTAVASILCGENVGVAPGASLLVYKVVNTEGQGCVDQMVRAINDAVEANVDVISLSVGTRACSEELLMAVSRALSKRIHVVCAAANQGSRNSTNVMYPARFGHTLCVGSCDNNGVHLPWSSIGREIDLLAPGEAVGCAAATHDYAVASGTSIAVPLVAGLVAVLVAHVKTLGIESLHTSEMKALLVTFCTHYGFHNQTDGYGALQVSAPHAWATLRHRIDAIRSETVLVEPVGLPQQRKVTKRERQEQRKAENAKKNTLAMQKRALDFVNIPKPQLPKIIQEEEGCLFYKIVSLCTFFLSIMITIAAVAVAQR